MVSATRVLFQKIFLEERPHIKYLTELGAVALGLMVLFTTFRLCQI